MKLVKTLEIPIAGSQCDMELMGQLLVEERRLINKALMVRRTSRFSV